MLRCFYQSIFGYPSSDFKLDYNKYGQQKFPQDPEQLSPFRRSRARIVADLITSNSTVIDLGCGDGAILLFLDRHSLIDGTGVDITEQAKTVLEANNLGFLKADISDFTNTDKIPSGDYVLLLEVIEHFANPETLISTYSGKAKKALILSVPNTGFVMHRIRLLFGRFPLQWKLYPGEHLRFWTIKDLHWWLNRQGYKNAQYSYYRGIPLLNKLCPNLFAAGVVVKLPVEISNKEESVC